MKYCAKCGNQMNDEVQFCPACGTPVAGAKPAAPQPAASGKAAKPAKSGKGKLIGIGIVAILAIVLIAFIGNKLGGKKVDMKDYVTISFSGYNSVGSASYEIDRVGMRLDIVNLISPTPSESDILSNLLSDMSIRLSTTDELSNGDTVEVTISHNAERFKKLGLKLTNTEWKVKVKDLEKPSKLDPFENVELVYNGIAPKMSVYAESTSTSNMYSLYYTVEPNSGLDIGDTVTVTLNNDVKSLLRQGYEVTETTKEYKVEKGDRYVTTCDDLTKDGLDTMKDEASDKIEAYFAQNASYIAAKDIEYLGTIVQMPKDSSWYGSNTVYVLYTAKVSSVSSSFEEQLVYLPVNFTDVIVYEDGIQDYGSVGSIAGSTDNMTFSWYSSVSGYNDLTKMFTDLVRSNKDNYEYSMSAEIEKIYQ